MTDEAGEDTKLVAVPNHRIFPAYSHVKTVEDLNPLTLERIAHFFQHYKDLEQGKWVKVNGWQGVDAAKTEITACVDAYNSSTEKPHF